MVSIKKPTKPDVEVKEEKVTTDAPKCECGEPVATHLGQTSVCAKHIRAS